MEKNVLGRDLDGEWLEGIELMSLAWRGGSKGATREKRRCEHEQIYPVTEAGNKTGGVTGVEWGLMRKKSSRMWKTWGFLTIN